MNENNTVIFFGMCKLFDMLNQKEIDIAEIINILTDQLKQLDVNSKNYIQTAKAIKDMILELKTNKENSDRTVLLNKYLAIQGLNDLNSLLNQANNKRIINDATINAAEKIGAPK